MRKFLNGLYFSSGALAAVFMLIIAGVILAKVAGRIFGFLIPSAAEIAGFSVAASTFLALAPTLQHGVHIRVTLVLSVLPERIRRWMEIWCLAATFALSVYYVYWLITLVIGSIRFGDVSPGLLAIPLAIPQSAMVLGAIIFAIALLDNLVVMLFLGGEPAYRATEQEGIATDNNDEPANRTEPEGGIAGENP